MSVRVPVAPAVLEWAQERSGHSEVEVESKFRRWHDWVSGETAPTLNQIEQIATYTRVPFGVFFLDDPPQIELPIPDYRMGTRGERLTPSPELLDSIYLSQQRQEWFRDYALRHGLPELDVAGQGAGLSATEAARLATQLLDVGVERRRTATRDQLRNHLRRGFEDLGGLVVFAGIVGNNTHRVLDRDEFRGFTLADPQVPLIFVNANDSLAGQFFTFFHEFAHVLRGESGVSDEDVTVSAASAAERWCNEVAAEVLVPLEDLRHEFRESAELRDELDRLSGRYQASTLVILLRLRELGLVPAAGFEDLFAAEQRHVQEVVDSRPRSSGGDFWNNQPFRTGERFARAIISETRAGTTAFTDALRLLALGSVEQLNKYAGKLGMR